jgi:hypothetical protein
MTKKEEKAIAERIKRATARIQKRIAKLEKEKQDLRELGGELASCVIWALNYLKASGAGMWFSEGKMMPWQTRFMDVLDKAGLKVDREAYWKKGKKR